jgi:hypothetical protein
VGRSGGRFGCSSRRPEGRDLHTANGSLTTTGHLSVFGPSLPR